MQQKKGEKKEKEKKLEQLKRNSRKLCRDTDTCVERERYSSKYKND